ncbi:MAG: Uma2 family endonuclease, partial [Rhodospirillaceae bacterium]
MCVVPRVPPFDRPATYDDLVGLPGGVVGEILDGQLHASPCPELRVAAAAVTLGRILLRPPGRDEDSDPWQILAEPELHLGADILVPRLAGWRGSRLRDLPDTPYFSLPPDWVCELRSAGTASFRARKMAIYAVEGVSHAWLIDPVGRTIEAQRLEDGRWTSVATRVGNETVR